MKEYKIAKGWAIFIYITAPLLVLLFGFLLIMPFTPGSNTNPNMLWFFAPLSIVMIVGLIIGLLDTYKSKFVIDKDKVYAKSTLSSRELLFTEIKGYHFNNKFIMIEPLSKNNKGIKINTYFENKQEIIEWLSDRYQDLNVVNAKKEHEE